MSPARSQIIMLAGLAARMGLSVGMTVLLGRSLTAQQFGFFALVATVFGLSHELTDMGTGNVAIRMATQGRSSERGMLETLLGLRSLLSTIAAGCCLALALLQDAASQRGLLVGTAVVLGFSYVSAYGTAFQLRQAQVAPAVLSVAVQVGAVLGAIALLALHVPGDWFAGLLVLREACVVVGVRTLAVRLLGYCPQPRFGRAAMRPFFGKAVTVAAGTLCYHLQFQGGPFFIDFLRPAPELGAFAAALRPLVPLLFIPWVIMLPLVPVLSWLAAGEGAAFRRQSEGALDLAVGLGAVAAVACAQLAPSVLQFLYGAQFSTGPLSAVAALRWLAVPLGCSFATAAMSTVLLADNRERLLLQISAAGLVLYVGANFWLLPRYGFVGSAMATAASIAGVTAAGLLSLKRGTGGFAPGWRLVAIGAPALLLAVALPMVGGPPVLRLAAGAVLSAAAAGAVWWFPGLPAYRAEQAATSSQLLADG